MNNNDGELQCDGTTSIETHRTARLDSDGTTRTECNCIIRMDSDSIIEMESNKVTQLFTLTALTVTEDFGDGLIINRRNDCCLIRVVTCE